MCRRHPIQVSDVAPVGPPMPEKGTKSVMQWCRLMRELKDFSSRRWGFVLHWSLGFCTVSFL